MTLGYKTTEFWITIFTLIATIASAVSGLVDEDYAYIVAAIASGAYAVSRGLAKKGK